MQLNRFLINRSQILVVEAQAPGAQFSRIKRAESDALQMVFKVCGFPFAVWRTFLALFLIPKVLGGYLAVQVLGAPVPAPALELANAKNDKKIGKKIGMNHGKSGRS